MSKSILVKYDLPPYVLVHDLDMRRAEWKDHYPTSFGYFHRDSVIAVVERKVGNRIKTRLNEQRREHSKTCGVAKRKLISNVSAILHKEGIHR